MPYSYDEMHRELRWLVDNARHVQIDRERLPAVAESIRRALAQDATKQTDPDPMQSPPQNDRDTLQFYLVLCSQEHLIWRRTAENKVEAWNITIDGRRYTGGRGIAAAHMRALLRGVPLLDAGYLASMTLADVEAFYRDEATGETDLQMLPQRLAKFNEIGRVLQKQFGGRSGGHVANLLRETGGRLWADDGCGLVQQLLSHFPIAFYDWPFNKLANLYGKFIAMRNLADVPSSDEFLELSQIHDPQHFEIAADYYIPLFFIRTGVFRIDDELARCLRERRLIARNSRMELEYRACTMIAGRELAALSGLPVPVVDEEVWRSGFTRCRLCTPQATDEELPCPHRELSVAYQQEHDLMELGWPLVMTTCY